MLSEMFNAWGVGLLSFPLVSFLSKTILYYGNGIFIDNSLLAVQETTDS